MDKRAYYQDPKVARSYEDRRIESPSGRLTQEMELAEIRKVFRPDQKLVELACGTGRLLRALRQEGWDVTGVDQSPAMLAAGGLLVGQEAVVGDVDHLPFPDGSRDGAFCFRFTNHYEDLSGFFQECSRILKPGGRLLFDVMRWSLIGKISSYPGGRNFTFSAPQIQSWLRPAGLKALSVKPLFLLGPYLMARFPVGFSRSLLRWQNALPASLQAVHLWQVVKENS